MKKFSPQLLPRFNAVKIVTSSDNYFSIYESEQKLKSAWLLDEKKSLSDFIEMLGAEDDKNNLEPLNFFDFYAAYNIKFPSTPETVFLANKTGAITNGLKDFAELLNAVLKIPHREQYAIFISKNNLSADTLKRKILQQFIYLRIYFPIIVEENFEVASSIFQSILQPTEENKLSDVGLFGTKKAGKSSMIDAILGDEYAPMSNDLPTPNKVIYAPTSKYRKLSLTFDGATENFYSVETLNQYTKLLFQEANKRSIALEEMQILIPKFPASLNQFRFIDTPGPNFAGSKEHAQVTKQAISKVDKAVFVMNYSQHLTQDEINLFDEVYKHFNNKNSKQTILVAVNRIDEMYAVPEVKSYERIADYLQKRLAALGYENILVVAVSALQAVYTRKIQQLLIFEEGTFYNRLKKLKAKYRGKDQATVISFINKSITNFEDFHGVEIDSVSELLKISRIYYLKHLIRWLFATVPEQKQNFSPIESSKKISVNPSTTKKILIYCWVQESRKILADILRQQTNNFIIEKNLSEYDIYSDLTGDLNIFVIEMFEGGTPNYKEINSFVELCRSGKNILLVVNITTNPTKYKFSSTMRWAVEDEMRSKWNKEETFRDFKKYVSRFHYVNFDWEKIPVVYVHLQAAYLGLKEHDKKLLNLSNFSELENFIQNFN